MADEQGTEKARDIFSSMLGTMLGGLDDVDRHVSRGPSHLLMALGALTFVASISGEFVMRFASSVSAGIGLQANELAVMLGSSVLLLVLGAGLRVWDSVRDERAEERRIRLRLEASERVEKIMLGVDQASRSGKKPPI